MAAEPKPPPALQTFRRAVSYLRSYWPSFLAAVLASGIVAYCANLNGKVMEMLVDKVLTPMNYAHLDDTLLFIVMIYAGRGLFSFVSRYLMFRVGHSVTFKLRSALYGHLVRLSLDFFQRRRTGQIQARFANDLQFVSNAMIVFNHSVTDVLHVVVALAILCNISARLTLLTLVLLPLLGLIVTKLSNRLRKWGALMMTRVGDITAHVHETCLGILEVKAFGAEEREIERFEVVNEDNLRINLKASKYTAANNPVVELFLAAGMAAVVWYGAILVIQGTLTSGRLLNFLTVLGLLFQPVRKLTDVNNVLKQSLGAFERIFGILDEPIRITNCDAPVVLETVRGKVEFRRACFQYEAGSEFCIENLDLTVEPGQVVAFVGPSGAGKSTVVSLIPRFYDLQDGAILVDDVPVRRLDLAHLRSLFGIVPQETILFSGTLGENIAYGRPRATIDEIRRAAKDANVLDFVDSLPLGLDTKIGERGVRLSGGQRQRVAIARALLKDPRILILDEATSSLDTESEKLVQEALERLMRGRTTFVIAHRLSTVIKADRIIVLAGGRVCETGTHHELIATNGLYRKLCEAQFCESHLEAVRAFDEGDVEAGGDSVADTEEAAAGSA